MSPRRSFGTVRRQTNGRWQARYRDATGEQHGAGTFPTKAEAGRALARIQVEIDKGRHIAPSAGRLSLKVYSDSWLTVRMVKGRPLAPRTKELYRHQLDKHILPTLGRAELRHLTPQAVRSWYAEMTGPNGPGQLTAAKCYRLLKAICATAVHDELITSNPCTIRGAGQEPETQRAMISVELVDKVANEVDRRWRALVLVAAWCALRFGEMAALRRSQVNLDGGTLEVSEAATRLAKGVLHIGPPKSSAGRRTVAIPPHIIDDLRYHLDYYAEPGPDGLVFVGPKGAPLRNSTFGRSVWRPARQAAGLPDGFHLHDLRGVSATRAAISGATVKELMHRLGHSTPDMAMKYQRAEEVRDAQLAAMMSEALLRRRAGQVPETGDADQAQ